MNVSLTPVRVTVEADTRYEHIVTYALFFDGERKSLCGWRPFPERWAETNPAVGDPVRTLCPTCANTWAGK